MRTPHKNRNNLSTPFESELGQVPYDVYPRPRLKRDSFLCLNGEWDLTIFEKEKRVFDSKILVPFPIESRLSGVQKQLEKGDTAVYTRSFYFDKENDRVLLHFGAVDNECKVYLNGKEVGSNTGGYLPFCFDITKALREGENTLKVVVKDALDKSYPYGKQTKKSKGMWYTSVSGIWQTVWIEQVPTDFISDIKVTPTLESVRVKVVGAVAEKTIVFDGQEHTFSGDEYTLEVKNPVCWTPENPHLYEFEIVSGADRVSSYFALRTVAVKDDKILLNDKPYFFSALLDQGYFSDGIFLPATPKGYVYDITLAKSLGFNTLRKHIKIEPELFYYYCDLYGMCVFQDAVNTGKYSFLIDTALPTVLPVARKLLKKSAKEKARKNFLSHTEKTFSHLYSYPSVVYYTLFNEGWGQFSPDKIYDKFKSLDPTRVIDTTSGWFFGKKSDVRSVHIYFKPLNLKSDSRPLVLSEFGGYSYKDDKHSYNPRVNYAYKFFGTSGEFCDGLQKLYLEEVLPQIKSQGLCACVLTQLSDVEDETNGLVTYDRQVLKVDKNTIKSINDTLKQAYLDRCK